MQNRVAFAWVIFKSVSLLFKGWYCNAAFPSNGNGRDMCTLASQAPIEQLYGTEPCRSLFSQYTVNLPKTDSEQGSITKNSKHLDVSPFSFY